MVLVAVPPIVAGGAMLVGYAHRPVAAKRGLHEWLNNLLGNAFGKRINFALY
jgi:hypothetical protein